MGRRNRGRDITGIVLLDKPAGVTSNGALQEVKRLFRARKAGHTGSLDPIATGLLPICLGAATKVSSFLLGADKRYQVTCRLGERTATGDSEGEIIERHTGDWPERAAVEAASAAFLGWIEQVPPMYSAIKHKGQRLYDLARRGVEVEREARRVRVDAFRILSHVDNVLELDIECSKGTYVRTLVDDLGQMLGTGAHVVALRRLGVGPYGADHMVTLDALRDSAAQGLESLDQWVLPIESALAHWPQVVVSEDAAYYLTQGQPVIVPRAPVEGWVRLYSKEERFLGVGQILDDGRVAPKRLLQAA